MFYVKFIKGRFILSFLQFFVALGAIPSGLLLIFDASGKKIGLDLVVLNQSPFKSFLLPGVFLFLLGAFQLIGAFYSFKSKDFVGVYGIFTGIILLLWLGIQIYFIGFNHVLQIVMIIVGLTQFFIAYKLMPHR